MMKFGKVSAAISVLFTHNLFIYISFFLASPQAIHYKPMIAQEDPG
jgi:hypothetical protein